MDEGQSAEGPPARPPLGASSVLTHLGGLRPALDLPREPQGGLTWVSLPHREGISGLVEDGQIIIDVLQTEAVLSPGNSGSRVGPPQTQPEKPIFPLTCGPFSLSISSDSAAHFRDDETDFKRTELDQTPPSGAPRSTAGPLKLGARLVPLSTAHGCLRPCSPEGWLYIPTCVPAWPSLTPHLSDLLCWSQYHRDPTNTQVLPGPLLSPVPPTLS